MYPGGLFGPPPRPPSRQALVLFFAIFAMLAALAAVGLVLVAPSVPSGPATVPVELCGHVYQVKPGHILDVTGFGPHCTNVKVSGG